ncbi:MAG: DUF6655 family protein [Verrucomicrobiales bacterium]
MNFKRMAFCLSLPALLISTGCVQTRITEPERSGVEQLLISTASDQAVEKMDVSFLSGRRVFVDRQFFEAYDEEYVLGSIRDHMSRNGALLVEDSDSADIIVEARSGALSTDSSSSVIGFPSTSLPIPLAGNFATPELALLKTQKQYSTAKFALLAYERESRRHMHSSGPVTGFANHHYYTVLGLIKFNKTTIPEKKKGADKADDAGDGHHHEGASHHSH